MLADDDMKLWHFSPLAVYDMWETEKATGEPRNSLYLRGMKLDKEFRFFTFLIESYAKHKGLTATEVLETLDKKI